MKTISQIINYTALCEFDAEDWVKVLRYCRENYKSGRICKSKRPKSHSTYQEFIEWIENGVGAGDVVEYRGMIGMVGYSLPDKFLIIAHLKYENFRLSDKLEVQPLPIDNDSLCKNNLAGDEHKTILRRAMYQEGMRYSATLNTLTEVYTPPKFSYVVWENPRTGERNTGIYIKSDGSICYFLAYEDGESVKYNHGIDTDYTPLWMADRKDCQRLDKAMAKDKKYFNPHIHEILPLTKDSAKNTYWYMNDRFEIVQDKDDGKSRHKARLNAGNYFLDYEKAIQFMKDTRIRRRCGY